MAVVIGTNAGFVSSAPVADPTGTATLMDTHATGLKDTSPAGTNKITEIGWWCDNATEEANFEVGLYSHHAGNDKPDARLFVDNTNAKGTGSGWKTVAVDWVISASTIYWIAAQLDNTATQTNIDRNADAGDRRSIITAGDTLNNPWDVGSNETSWAEAIYAKWEATTTYSELKGTIAAESTVSGNLDTTAINQLAGTIAAASTVSGNLGSTTVGIDVQTSFVKRLIVAGNNQIQYEDI
jgi:hypothetical protein